MHKSVPGLTEFIRETLTSTKPEDDGARLSLEDAYCCNFRPYEMRCQIGPLPPFRLGPAQQASMALYPLLLPMGQNTEEHLALRDGPAMRDVSGEDAYPIA